MKQTKLLLKPHYFLRLLILCLICPILVPGIAWADEIKAEAENATLTGVNIVNSTPGFSGAGYAWDFSAEGANITFKVHATAGLYVLNIRYTSPYDPKGYDLLVNDVSGSGMFAKTDNGFGTVKAGEFGLKDGENTINISRGWGYYGIDYIQLTPVAPPADIKLEAENSILTGVEVANSVSGYSGTGYVWGFDAGTDHIQFDFPAKAGLYELSIIYYSPFGEKWCSLQVNATSSEQKFTGTGEGFGAVAVGKYPLMEGTNTIKITSNWGWYGIDYISLTPVTDKPVIIVPLVNGKAEAELAEIDGVEVATSPAGFSGTGFVTSFDNATDKVIINFETKAGLYDLSIGYTSPFGEKGYDLQVNEEKGSGMFAATGETFSAVLSGKYLLKEGLNTVTITRGWGYFGIDYIQLTPTSAPLPVKPPKLLTDAKATSATRSLFSYLVDIYGSKVLSGQQDDVDYILEKTGKEPAIGAFDFMDYSPSRVENGTNPTGSTERYIQWAKKGEGNGMITMMWHWNAPTDLINEAPDKLWWSGFYTRATTFDLATALADKNSDRYKLLIRDIDVIAIELRKFSDAGIPVLWRPLHEAAGGWFWWGAKGAEPFKELWRIMYDRLQNHHKLHNLIWVYTTDTNINWYPGDAYVDIVGPDIYTDASSNMSGEWQAMQNLFGGKKLVALTETGTLPVPDKVRGYGTWWSWFSVWTGSFIKDQPIELLNQVYHDEDVITRDELPDWKNYGKPTVAITAPATNSEVLLCQPVLLSATATDAEGTVEKVGFYDGDQLIGQGTKNAGSWEFSWADPKPGIYTIHAEATDNEGLTSLSTPVSFTVKADTQAPVITVYAAKKILWEPNHQYHTIRVSDFVQSITDNCAASLPVSSVRIKKVSSDEAENAPGSGNTKHDIVIQADCHAVQLRAERSGNGNGRVYVIEVEITDQAGNTGTATYEVLVPHNPGKVALADKVAYTVMGKCSNSTARYNLVAEQSTEEMAEITAYPNPVSGNRLTVQVYASADQEADFSFVNANSHKVSVAKKVLKAGKNEVMLSTANLPNGVYVLIIQTGDWQSARKIVVLK